MKKFLLLLPLFVSTHCAAQGWQTAANNGQILAFGVHDTNFFEGDAGGIGRYEPWKNPPFKWVEADTGIDLTQGGISSFASLGRYFFAGQANGGPVTFSTNDGSRWSAQIADGPIASNDTYLFATLYSFYNNSHPQYLIRSKDFGVTWDSLMNLSSPTYAVNGSHIFAANANGVWSSTNNGTDWVKDTLPLATITSIAFIGSLTFGSNGTLNWDATPGPIVKSTNSGSTWTEITLPGRIVTQLVSSGTYLFAGTDSGVFLSTDSGSNWRNVSDGLGKFLRINALGVFDTLLFANATDVTNFGKWYTASRSIREMVKDTPLSVISVQPAADSIEVYPNPSAGTIRILSSDPIFSIQVVSIMGTDVLSRPSEDASHLTLDLSNKPAGTYFLEIQTAKGIVLKKITLER